MSQWLLITGASRGIGKSIALACAKPDTHLVVHYRQREAEANAVAAEVRAQGAEASVVGFDVADRAAARAALEALVAKNGAPYGVVCNAGMTADGAFPLLTGEAWDQVVQTSLGGFYNVLHPLVMPMVQGRKPGRIVTIASVSGLMGNRGQTNYSAAKAGVIGATKALAVELAKRNITVNCVAPGLIDTDMVTEEVRERALQVIPQRRLGRPDEVAAAVVFLLSAQASYITRQVISVNGGMV